MHALFDRAAHAAQASSSPATTGIDRRRFIKLGGTVAGAAPFAFALGIAADDAAAQAATDDFAQRRLERAQFVGQLEGQVQEAPVHRAQLKGQGGRGGLGSG